MKRTALLLGTIALVAQGIVGSDKAYGATLRVAKDGSGQFTVLHEAVDAAASGDTISIGPGEYPEMREYPEIQVGRQYSAVITVSDLTIVGDSRHDVMIGPDVAIAPPNEGPAGVVALDGTRVRIRSVTVRGFAFGLVSIGDVMFIQDVEVEKCRIGCDLATSEASAVVASEFRESSSHGVFAVRRTGSEAGVIVSDCVFSNCQIGVDFQLSGSVLERSAFFGGRAGAQVSFGASATIRDCSFRVDGWTGVFVPGGSGAILRDCVFERLMVANVQAFGSLSGDGNVLKGGTTAATLVVGLLGEYDFHGNHILNGGGDTIRAEGSGPTPAVHDFSNNYWGTVDTAQLDAWILDSNDDPVSDTTINYLPLADAPIGNEPSSFGSIKSRYR